jgi:hypothetical protein
MTAQTIEHRVVGRVDVARGTGKLVRAAGDREGVIESPLQPARISCEVTHDARRREPGGLVIRIGCRVVVVLMTAVAISRQPPVILAVDVATRTRQCRMRALQREARRAVIEFTLKPACVSRLMANDAIRWEAGLLVIRICRRVVSGLVTSVAICRQPCEFPPHVAAGARQFRVSTEQREHRAVVKAALRPKCVSRLVAHDTVGREPSLRMIGVRRRVVSGLVASVAICRQPRELAANVARCALQLRVCAEQREHRVVIELALSPQSVGRLVTDNAVRREAGLLMVRLRGRVVGRLVASVTVSRQSRELAAYVAGRTSELRVRAEQREHRVVIELALSPQSVRRLVTDNAVRREAGLLMVWLRGRVVSGLVASVAVRRQPRELTAYVAGRASKLRMSAYQREDRAVIEPAQRPGCVRRLMTNDAVRREPGLAVIGIGRRVVHTLMARIAVL